MIKKIFLSVLICVGLIVAVGHVLAEDNVVDAYLFYGNGCPHCAQERDFLDSLKNDYPNLLVHEYELYESQENVIILQKIAQSLNIRVDGVPFLIIGEGKFMGYAPGVTSEEIKNKIEECSADKCPDLVFSILEDGDAGVDAKSSQEKENQSIRSLTLPVLGEINTKDFSLPVLTVVMGILDGFNPCAMWVLLFLISMLLGMSDRRRMWILGVAFIIASASVYFIFMAAWLNLIIFLGFIIWIRLLIGLLALIGGGYSIKEFFLNRESGCKVAGEEKRQKIFSKIKDVINQNSFWMALGGIIVLAFMVNLIELVCSAGLPAVYTQVLALSNLPAWQYYLYILLYIFLFMLDDLFVFFVAMTTLQMTGVTTKYAKYSRLIGGILMIAIGIILIIKPELLMFG